MGSYGRGTQFPRRDSYRREQQTANDLINDGDAEGTHRDKRESEKRSCTKEDVTAAATEVVESHPYSSFESGLIQEQRIRAQHRSRAWFFSYKNSDLLHC